MSALPRALRRRLLAGLLATSPLAAGAAPAASVPAPAPPPASGGDVRLGAVGRQLAAAEEAVRAVETEFSQRAEPTAAEVRARRFSDGEILSLLGHHAAASVLFSDLVSDPAFRQSPQYGEALYYLGEALYQQGDLVGARAYLRELLARGAPRFREALVRALDIAARLHQLEDVEAYVERARGRDGTLPPEIAYAWGRSLFLRRDVPVAERLARARAVLAPLARNAASPVQLLSTYFLGVCHVQAGELGPAAERFRAVLALTPHGERDARVRELASLSLGRVLSELGRHAEAVDRYQDIGRNSPLFPEALHEMAWAQVRMGEHARARATTDLLLMVAPDSPLAPQTRLLQGHLLLALERYGEAAAAYDTVVNTFAPVRDELDATLSLHADPATYFDALLARNARDLDAGELLPEGMRRYARIPQTVSGGLRVVADLQKTRADLAEARALAARIDTLLRERGLEAFPELHQGYLRADAADTALVRAEQALVELAGAAAGPLLTPAERERWEGLRRDREALQARLAPLPATPQEVDGRRMRLQARVDALTTEALTLGGTLQSLAAQQAAVERWAVDTRAVRAPAPEQERAFLARLQGEGEALGELEQALARVREALAEERARAGYSIGGEERLKAGLRALLAEELRLFEAAGARGGAEAQTLLAQARAQQQRAEALRARTSRAKDALQGRLAGRAAQLREQVATEVKLLEAAEREVAQLSGEARPLVGRVAFDAFRQVREQFSELVLKADLGVLEVALTRKANHTAEIQRVGAQKERDLRQLDEEFREVLTPEGL